MTLPSFNAEQSLYRSSRHYRASALASAAGSVRPSDLPPGSYQQSCSCWSDGTCLQCFCEDGSGRGCFKYAALSPISSCQGFDIYNHYGYLECDAPGVTYGYCLGTG